MTSSRKIAALAGGLAMTAGLLVGGAGSAGAAGQGVRAACYDGDVGFNKSAGTRWYPSSSTSRLTTSSNCNDINLRFTDGGRNVKVCFYPSDGGVQCQDDYTYVGSSWTVVATDVRDGTKYRVYFLTDGAATGFYAD
ncbi:hypothetical protein [Streptomyces acidiscabies]|uniref:hypothetical protein n=1 Tax=Streptomyces acidiscabies TaxID=42234 RepID=UPI00131ABBBE|nr:hypothetical protein [Streptomyces acidiscabies]